MRKYSLKKLLHILGYCCLISLAPAMEKDLSNSAIGKRNAEHLIKATQEAVTQEGSQESDLKRRRLDLEAEEVEAKELPPLKSL